MTKTLNCGMTPGMGDAMLALNLAYRWSHWNQERLILNLHWTHGPEHLHHPEDPETIIERTDYVNALYAKGNSDVEVNHIFNTDRTDILNTTTRYDWLDPREHKKTNSWMFKPEIQLPVEKKKVVIWRPVFNAEVPKYWKRIVPNDQWNRIIDLYKEDGYNVVELCYRTPIREVLYHINTCEFILCYDGMWHYIAKNFLKPMIVASHDGITRYHTRHAVALSQHKFIDWTRGLHIPIYMPNIESTLSPYDLMHMRANEYKESFWRGYHEGR